MQKYGPNTNPEEFLHFLKIADVFQPTENLVEAEVVDVDRV